MKKMKRGKRKDWEYRLRDCKSVSEHQSIIKEWYNEWLEFDKESYRMSQVRFQEHKIERQKIIQHDRENLEWGLEIIETYKKTNQISDVEYLNTKNEILKSLGHNSALLKSSQS